MSQLIRRQVLDIFKRLHRTRQLVFNGDIETLDFARNKINEDFKVNKNVDDPEKVKELLRYAKAIELELRTSVIQMVEKEENHYALNFREDQLLDNVEFNENAVIEKPRRRSKCSDPPATTSEGDTGKKPK